MFFPGEIDSRLLEVRIILKLSVFSWYLIYCLAHTGHSISERNKLINERRGEYWWGIRKLDALHNWWHLEQKQAYVLFSPNFSFYSSRLHCPNCLLNTCSATLLNWNVLWVWYIPPDFKDLVPQRKNVYIINNFYIDCIFIMLMF